MADRAEIEPAAEQAGKAGKESRKKKSEKREKPDDAVKLGCGGLFRRKKKSGKAGKGGGGENGTGEGDAGASKAPVEKPTKPPPPSAAGGKVKGTVKTEEDVQHEAPAVESEVKPVHVATQKSAWVRPPIVKPERPPEGPKLPLSQLAAAGDSGRMQQPRPNADNPAAGHSPAVSEHANDEEEQTQIRSTDIVIAQMEESPQSPMWSSIVTNSMVGTGIFKRAAACSLSTGGVLACCPAGFTPSVEQVAALRDNFANREVFSGAGFGVADTVYNLQEETATPEVLCGANSGQTEGVLVTRSNTALLIGTFTEKLDQAMETLSELRTHFVGEGL